MIELLGIGFSTVWVYGFTINCVHEAVFAVQVAIIIAWILAFFMLIWFVVIFDPLGSRNDRNQIRCCLSQTEQSSQIELSVTSPSTIKVWEQRLVCFMYGIVNIMWLDYYWLCYESQNSVVLLILSGLLFEM